MTAERAKQIANGRSLARRVPRGIQWVPWGVLLLALAVTWFAWQQQEALRQSADRSRLDREVERAQAEIVARMSNYENLLDNVRGLFTASGSIDRARWQQYVSTLDLAERYPGISGVGLVVEVPSRLLPTFESSTRAEDLPGYHVWPQSERAVYLPVKYVEPLDANAAALGFDIGSDPAGLEAADRARDTGLPALSARLAAQPPNERTQFLLLVPVYRPQMPQTSVLERRAALLGWVYAPFEVNALMSGILGPGAPQVDLQIYDGAAAQAGALLYDSGQRPAGTPPTLAASAPLQLSGRVWTLGFIPLPAFQAAGANNQPLVVLIGGLALSSLLFGLTLTLLNTRTTALALAGRMTRDLRESEARFRLITENAADLIAVVDREGNRLYNSPSYRTIMGYDPEDLKGSWSFVEIHPDDREKVLEAARETRSTGLGRPLEYRMKAQDGSWRVLESISSGIKNDAGEVENLVIVARDVTQRKQAEEALRREEALRQQNEYLAALHDTTVGLIRHLDLAELLENIVARAGALVGTEHGYVFLPPPEDGASGAAGLATGEIEMRIGVGAYTDFVGTRARPGVGLAGMVWESGQPLVVDDYRTWPGRLTSPSRDILRAVVGVPLKSGDRLLGVIGLAYLEKGRKFGPAELEVLNRFAQLAAIALDNARLYAVAQAELAERKRAEAEMAASLQEKEVLLKEIHHRVKNNLQVIMSLLSLQAGLVHDLQTVEVLRESQSRVRSMALIHEKLYQSRDLARVDLDGYVRNLVAYLFRSYNVNPAAVQLRINIHDALLGIDKAIPCGLIINELVSNALKHGFPNGRRGEIEVDLYPQDGRGLALTVRDDGVGLPPDFDLDRAESLGWQLVKTLTDQLGGDIAQHSRGGGAGFTITFPK